MAASKELKDVLKLLADISDKLSQIEGNTNKITKVEKRLAVIERDIALIKECVSTENADNFPSLKRSGSGSRSHISLAASGK